MIICQVGSLLLEQNIFFAVKETGLVKFKIDHPLKHREMLSEMCYLPFYTTF